jgi:hypothetical protein
MKKLIFILGVVLATGCSINKCAITEPYGGPTIIFAVDSTGVYEDSNNLGTFYKIYDTVFISSTQGYDRKGNYKTSFKILNK